MSRRALAYLLVVRLKNYLAGVVRSPRRLVGVLLMVGLFALMIVARSMDEAGTPAVGANVIWSLLSLYLLLAVFGGFGEPGLRFQASDLDYVLPGPFRRSAVLVYYLARQYAQILVLSLLYAVFLGAAGMPHPTWAWLGILLCLVAASHLQLITTLSTAMVSDRVFARLRRASRVLLVGLLLVAAAVAVAAVATQADVPGLLLRLQEHGIVRVLTNPALQATRLARAATAAQALPALGALLAWVVASFAVVLLFPVNFLESAYTTTAKRKRETAAPTSRVAGAGARPVPGFFRGAGAVAWLNVLALRRRLRMIVGLVAVLLVILLVSFQRGRDGGGETGGLPSILFVLAFFPVIANLPLGFRGHLEHLEMLKTLPLSPWRLALAEVVVPSAAIWLVQAFVIVLVWGLGRLDTAWAAAALLILPVLDVGVTVIVELFQFGKERSQLGFLTTTLQMVTIVATVAAAAGAAALAMLVVPHPAAGLVAGVLAYAGIDVVLLGLLGRRFANTEPGSWSD